MSTRALVEFYAIGGGPVAVVYKHHDGRPDGPTGMLALFDRFFAEVEEKCGADTRFHDPSYLAARFVFWLLEDYGGLHSRGVGILTAGGFYGQAFTYRLRCLGDGRPKVEYREGQ